MTVISAQQDFTVHIEQPEQQSALKRAADLKAPAAKRVRCDPVQEKIDLVCRTLAEPGRPVPGPASCREMLLTLAPAALADPRDQRHSHQESWAAMIGHFLEAEQARLEGLVAGVKGDVDSIHAERDRRQEIAAQAEAVLEAKKVEAKEKSRILVDAARALRDAEGALSVAVIEKGEVEDAQKQFNVEKELFGEAKCGDFEEMKKGLEEDEDVKTMHLTVLTDRLNRLHVDKSLLKALPATFWTSPAERGEFDAMVIEEVEETFAQHLTSLDEKIANGIDAIAKKGEAIVAAEAAQSAAAEQKKVAVDAFIVADTERKQLEASLHNAKQVVVEYRATLEESEKALWAEDLALEHIQSVQRAFEWLVQRESTPEAAAVV